MQAQPESDTRRLLESVGSGYVTCVSTAGGKPQCLLPYVIGLYHKGPGYDLSLSVQWTTLHLCDMPHIKKDYLYHSAGCEWGCTLEMCFIKPLPHASQLQN